MPQTLSRALRIRLIHSEHLAACLEDAHWVTGLDAAFLAPDGSLICAYPRKPEPNICTLIRGRPGSFSGCATCHRMNGRQGIVSQVPPDCPAYLKSLEHELRVDDQAVGRFVLWPIRDAGIGPERAREAWTRLAREGASISWSEWKSAWDKTIAFSDKQLAATRRWLVLAVKELMRELDADPRLSGSDKALPGLVHRVCIIVRERHSEPLRLSGIARSCGVTAEHMSRMFHQATGLRFRDYLREVRMNESCRLLLDDQLRIAEIAEQVGHSSISRFNKAFKEYMGMTPGEWRRRSRRRVSGIQRDGSEY
ncbi:MAG: HTH-type transcriptional regulator YesS [Verrucomicrobia bacterium ADurb.Bin474]|nr:MAG: HTH-type transcriptional regulator YesS [Verrucomicrobia bacterium ADurb.Bin474]